MNKPLPTTALLALAASLTAPLAAQWQEVTTTGQPGTLRATAMSTATNGSTVMFGGDNGMFPSPFNNETWSWAGDWTLITSTGPGGRAEARMVFDAQRGVHVLYGGWNSPFSIGSGIDETWEFNGATWTQVFPVNSPGGLWKHSMCYDSSRNVTVLFGGAPTGLPGASSQTWEFNGTDWSQITTSGTPGPRENAAMCFDTVLNQCLMFGGVDPFVGASNQLWIYNGNAWQQIPQTANWPSARTGMEMVFDPIRNRAIMTGGTDSLGNALDDTWEFDGLQLAWSQIPTTGASGNNFGMTWNNVFRRAIRYGGSNNSDETWTYGATDMQFGMGCTGSNGVPVIDAPDAPRLGVTYVLQCANMNPTTGLGAFVLSLTETAPTPLDSIGMIGCTAYITPDLLVSVTPSGIGVGTWSALIPNNQNLLGIEMFAQGLSIDPGINPAWLISSNAHVGVLGF